MGRSPHATATATDAEAPPRLVILLGALTAFSPLAIDMYLPAFPQIERDLAAPPGAGERMGCRPSSHPLGGLCVAGGRRGQFQTIDFDGIGLMKGGVERGPSVDPNLKIGI